MVNNATGLPPFVTLAILNNSKMSWNAVGRLIIIQGDLYTWVLFFNAVSCWTKCQAVDKPRLLCPLNTFSFSNKAFSINWILVDIMFFAITIGFFWIDNFLQQYKSIIFFQGYKARPPFFKISNITSLWGNFRSMYHLKNETFINPRLLRLTDVINDFQLILVLSVNLLSVSVLYSSKIKTLSFLFNLRNRNLESVRTAAVMT